MADIVEQPSKSQVPDGIRSPTEWVMPKLDESLVTDDDFPEYLAERLPQGL